MSLSSFIGYQAVWFIAVIGAALGAIGGPLAYLAAARGWGAVIFIAPAWRAELLLAVGWAAAMLVLLRANRPRPGMAR